MNMDLQKQIENLHTKFCDIHQDDHESKVNNVKSRIYLMKQLIGYDPPTLVHKPVQEKPVKDNRSEMNELRRKLVPKTKSLPFNEKDLAEKNADE